MDNVSPAPITAGTDKEPGRIFFLRLKIWSLGFKIFKIGFSKNPVLKSLKKHRDYMQKFFNKNILNRCVSKIMRYIHNEQCKDCEFVDNNATGIYCSLILPPPETIDGRCTKYQKDITAPYEEDV